MSIKPFFSIITPTYNRASFLEEMIASVTAQSFQNFEHIIVDDGSTDETEELVNGLIEEHPKIVYIKQDNKGRSVARNVGIEHAKGEYVCFLDSDDQWSGSYLSELHDRASESEFLATRMVWVNGSTKKKTLRPIEGFTHSYPQRIIEQEIGMNVCVRRTLFSGNLFNVALSINEDFELWTRIISKSNVDVIAVPESLYLVTTPEIVGQVTFELLAGMDEAQEIMKANVVMKKWVSSSFWKHRSKGILLRRIRVYEANPTERGLISAILNFLFSYPTDPINKSLFVILLYNLPGGQLLKSLVASIKRQ
ncbi:MAG: glycosyltransferase involved in cell wall biosynthesis [Bacteroidia bacterium]|jgi:glycosyltransferase involved in cell wall biosynthesis